MATGDQFDIREKSSDSDQNLKSHTNTVQEVKDIQCGECDALFSGQELFEKHFMSLHEQSKPKHECTICEKSYATLSSLKNHIDISHEEKKDFQCGDCGRLFSKRSLLKSHFRNVHEETLPQCKVCKTRKVSEIISNIPIQKARRSVISVMNYCLIIIL